MGSITYFDPLWKRLGFCKLVSHHRNIIKSSGTNYQSIIAHKNCLYEDSKMYQAMEEYITENLHKKCGEFFKVRGDVWIEAFFRALKTGKQKDWIVEKQIRKEQHNKKLLFSLLVSKSSNIIGRKLKVHK